ncbi:hypothetical protein CHARACLAT_008981 [Characodon lateralis]|uniref:Uncharacterized protein n=1 Tax=Characodon lateralis TaxID=208331 RepID=A0ABU7CM40_9TELE|nr:hypothetical protein [Characodon lateralis]
MDHWLSGTVVCIWHPAERCAVHLSPIYIVFNKCHCLFFVAWAFSDLRSSLSAQLAALQRMFMCYRSAVRQHAAELICLTGAEERFVRAIAPCWRSDLSEFLPSFNPRSDQTLSNIDSQGTTLKQFLTFSSFNLN